MYLKQRGEVLDNRAKHNELHAEVDTVATAQVMLGRLSEKHMSDCGTCYPTSAW